MLHKISRNSVRGSFRAAKVMVKTTRHGSSWFPPAFPMKNMYDEDYVYLSGLENGRFVFDLPRAAGNYNLRINGGTATVVYLTFTAE